MPLGLCMLLQKLCYCIHDIFDFLFAHILMDPNMEPIISNIFSVWKIAQLIVQKAKTRTLGRHGKKKTPRVYPILLHKVDKLIPCKWGTLSQYYRKGVGTDLFVRLFGDGIKILPELSKSLYHCEKIFTLLLKYFIKHIKIPQAHRRLQFIHFGRKPYSFELEADIRTLSGLESFRTITGTDIQDTALTFTCPSVRAEGSQDLGKIRPVSDNHTAFDGCYVMGQIGAIGSHVSNGSYVFPSIYCPVGFSRISNNIEIAFLSCLNNRIHIRWFPHEVDRHDGLCLL